MFQHPKQRRRTRTNGGNQQYPVQNATTPMASWLPSPALPTTATTAATATATATATTSVSSATLDNPASAIGVGKLAQALATKDGVRPNTDGGSATSSTTGTTITSNLQDTSVLAEQFVPNELKRVNHLNLSARIACPKLPTLERELEAIFHICVPPSQCLCSQRHTTFRRIHSQEPELWFAMNTPPEMMETSDSLPRVSNITTLVDYIQTFKSLLHRERRETLMLFERYSQYKHKLGHQAHRPAKNSSPEYPQHPNTFPATASMMIPGNQQGQQVASFCIPGIADANPAIQPGDTVLLRPMKLVSLPLTHGGYTRNDSFTEWSPPIHSIEIQAEVIQVARSKDGRSDRVLATWLPLHDQKNLISSYPQCEFNIRFVPSTKSYNRCLTALDWCASLPPDVAMNLLLFPSRAPPLPSTCTVHLSPESILDERDDLASLNKAQMQFVDMVLRRTHHPCTHPHEEFVRPPMILTGPAGTGKTKTLLAAIKEVLRLPQSNRILVCAPSHTAANVITRRLAESLPATEKQNLFRLLDSDRPVETVPSDILPYCRQDTTSGSFTLPVQNILKFSVIVCTCSDAHLLFKAGITNAQLRDRRQCFRHWMKTVLSHTNLSMNGTLDGVDEPHFTHLFVDEASQATEPETLICLSIVVDTTPNTYPTDNGNHNETTTTTNNILRPPTRRRPCEIALVGDPRQLSPQVYSQAAATCGLGHAWMERLLQRPIPALGGGHPHLLGPTLSTMTDFVQDSFQSLYNNNLSSFLTMNYRSHPSFLMMPSALFYFDKLQSARGFDEEHENGSDIYNGKRNGNGSAHVTPSWPGKLQHIVEGLSEQVDLTAGESSSESVSLDLPPLLRNVKKQSWPIHFQGVRGRDTSVTIDFFCGTNSWSNLPEATAVVEIVVALGDQGVSTQAVGVMAPFRGQVVLIRKLLREKNLSGVNVGTIEDYQAVEREIVILSLTRSNENFIKRDADSRVGVFGQPKRTNVAITRARDIFIVVGDPYVMLKDLIWRQWLWFCLRNGLWYGEGKDAIKDWFREPKTCRIAKHLPTIHDDGNVYDFANGDEEQSEGETGKEKCSDELIVISTLEEICTREG